ncbi:MAG: hypothetical protein DMG39_00865 [Acidobacteria bacterium]|nr:MAG: hypothetical protein DMG39_00865 [Acidobacteriota bacterium]
MVGDVRDTDLAAESTGMIYIPGYAGTTLIIRTRANPTAFVAAIREAINEVDSSVPVYDVNSMQDLLAASLQKRKFVTLLLTIFAALALVLASVGLYAVLSYVVTRRTREIGIRIAIGASNANILLLIFRHGLIVTLFGMALGLGISLLLKPLIASQLFGIKVFDGATFSLAATVLLRGKSCRSLRARSPPLKAFRYRELRAPQPRRVSALSIQMLLTASSIRDSGARRPGGESRGGCRGAAADKWSMECKHKGDFPGD